VDSAVRLVAYLSSAPSRLFSVVIEGSETMIDPSVDTSYFFRQCQVSCAILLPFPLWARRMIVDVRISFGHFSLGEWRQNDIRHGFALMIHPFMLRKEMGVQSERK